MPYEELQIPGEPGVWQCAKHKNTSTRLRCGRCEKPICPKCTIMAPTGARCRDCTSNRDAHMYQVAPKHLALAFGASVGVGALGAAVTQLAGAFWFWALLYAPAIGPVWGRAITKITGGKRGPKVALVVSAGLVLGALLASFGAAFFLYNQTMHEMEPMLEGLSPQQAAKARAGMQKVPLPTPFLVLMAFANLPLWAFIVLAVIGAWWWLK